MLKPVTEKRSNGTKVKVTGFEWNIESKKYNPQDLCQYLELISGAKRGKTKVFCKKHGEVYIGLVVTINDMKAFTTWEEDGGGLTTTELEKGKSMADFNYFIVHPIAGRGLYQYYYKSSTLNVFGLVCKKLAIEMKDKAIENDIEDMKNRNGVDDLKQPEITKIRKKHALKFRYSQVTKFKNFNSFVKTMTDIKTFEFEVTTSDTMNSDRVALSRYAKRTSHRMTFENTSGKMSSIRSAVTKLMPDLRSAKIIGNDPDNVEQIFRLDKNYEVFEEYDFNEVVQTIMYDAADMEKSLSEAAMIKAMLGIFQQPGTKELLSIPAKP